MPKLKSKRNAAKRFKITGTGKVRASKSNRRHILTSKTAKRKRQNRRGLTLNKTEGKRLKRILLGE